MAFFLKDMRVLLVDDFRDMRISLRSMVESLYAKEVVEAKSGEDALELLAAKRFDVVLCDYNLGDGKDGQQVFEEAKFLGILPAHTAWVMITAENTMEMVMAVVEFYPDGYLVKPINKSVLQLRLERVLKRKSAVQDIEAALAARDPERARALCDAQLQKHPQLKLDLLKYKSEALLQAGHYDAAGELCAGVLQEREVPWALLGLGRARHAAGDLRQAKSIFMRLIEQSRTNMEAYDCLSRVEHDMGNPRAAQQALEQAIATSPKSIRRQQALGDMARANGDYMVAEKAYERAVHLGQYSCFGRPDDQIGLVDSISLNKGPEYGLKALHDLTRKNARRLAKKGEAPHWRLALAEGRLLQATGEPAEAKTAVARALEGFRNDPAVSIAVTLELAKTCFQTGAAADAQAIVDRMIRENHDRDEVIGAARAMFEDLGMKDEGAALIETAQQALIDINNQGVKLAQAGSFDEAVALLTKAADELPSNLTVMLNVVQALILQMRAQGPSNQRRYAAGEFMQRAERIEAANVKVARLKQQLENIATPAAKQAQTL